MESFFVAVQPERLLVAGSVVGLGKVFCDALLFCDFVMQKCPVIWTLSVLGSRSNFIGGVKNDISRKNI